MKKTKPIRRPSSLWKYSHQKIPLNPAMSIPKLTCRNSGVSWYLTNASRHCSSLSGGRVPTMGCHSTMESPEWVRRVTPPTTIIRKTVKQQMSSQAAIKGSVGCCTGFPCPLPFPLVRYGCSPLTDYGNLRRSRSNTRAWSCRIDRDEPPRAWQNGTREEVAAYGSHRRTGNGTAGAVRTRDGGDFRSAAGRQDHADSEPRAAPALPRAQAQWFSMPGYFVSRRPLRNRHQPGTGRRLKPGRG